MPPKTSCKACQKKRARRKKNISKSDRKRSAGGRKVTQFTSTKVLKQVHPDTASSTIFSNVSLRKLPDWHITTKRATITSREIPDSRTTIAYRENWPSTQSAKVPKPSPSTPGSK
ncbi:unnamed protein product [Acanthoscelides obtectus]|uniref:Uncharacterized protein n=1 Tax=Acanthoscelides obtectus TaxID=200917 RepID=A0A9P0VTT5_ACAOB|nr:unnamed protein product [Acanthoscelides obtectus]CAK1683344.1 hypothetical protein AOBTE_LOCUS34210 [Acanthoscelides obtectus]